MLAFWSGVGLNERVSYMEVVDLTPLYKKYKGQWVALKDDQVSVISNGTNLKKVVEVANKKGFNKPTLFKVPSRALPFIG